MKHDFQQAAGSSRYPKSQQPNQSPKRRLPPFSMRLTADERAKIEAKAGGRPLSAYIKSVVLADDAPRYRKRRVMPAADQRLLAAILARLGASRSAANLNQIAKAIHTGTLHIDDAVTADIHAACADVAWMRATLIAAMGLSVRDGQQR